MPYYAAGLSILALIAILCTADLIRMRREAQKQLRALLASRLAQDDYAAQSALIYEAACRLYADAAGWDLRPKQERLH
jgi:hypothetical protein